MSKLTCRRTLKLNRLEGACCCEELQEDWQGGPPADVLESAALPALHCLEAEDAALALADPVVLELGQEEHLEVQAGQPVKVPGTVSDVARAD